MKLVCNIKAPNVRIRSKMQNLHVWLLYWRYTVSYGRLNNSKSRWMGHSNLCIDGFLTSDVARCTRYDMSTLCREFVRGIYKIRLTNNEKWATYKNVVIYIKEISMWTFLYVLTSIFSKKKNWDWPCKEWIKGLCICAEWEMRKFYLVPKTHIHWL